MSQKIVEKSQIENTTVARISFDSDDEPDRKIICQLALLTLTLSQSKNILRFLRSQKIINIEKCLIGFVLEKSLVPSC